MTQDIHAHDILYAVYIAVYCNILQYIAVHRFSTGYECTICMATISPVILDFDPEINSTKLNFSGYVHNITGNNWASIPVQSQVC